MTRKWWNMANIYKRFAKDAFYDFSDSAAQEMFDYESKGIPVTTWNNGFFHGKRTMDLTITEYWIPDLKEGRILFNFELYEDFPEWFLNRVLPKEFHLNEH